jgi:hypothetical protein
MEECLSSPPLSGFMSCDGLASFILRRVLFNIRLRSCCEASRLISGCWPLLSFSSTSIARSAAYILILLPSGHLSACGMVLRPSAHSIGDCAGAHRASVAAGRSTPEKRTLCYSICISVSLLDRPPSAGSPPSPPPADGDHGGCRDWL